MSHFLGQCFLVNQESIDYINTIIQNNYTNELLVEIGPGPGIMTNFLYQLSNNLKLYELDTSFTHKLLKIVGNDQIIWGDVLKTWQHPTSNTLVYGSLPYYITSPILRLVCDGRFVTGVFVIQHEVGEKIATLAKKKSYLWWLLNFYYDISYEYKIPRSHFNPAPKVDSCCVLLKPRPNPVGTQEDFNQLIKILDMISGFKRKTLGAIAKLIGNNNMHDFLIVSQLGSKRIEELNRQEMMQIVKNSGP